MKLKFEYFFKVVQLYTNFRPLKLDVSLFLIKNGLLQVLMSPPTL